MRRSCARFTSLRSSRRAGLASSVTCPLSSMHRSISRMRGVNSATRSTIVAKVGRSSRRLPTSPRTVRARDRAVATSRSSWGPRTCPLVACLARSRTSAAEARERLGRKERSLRASAVSAGAAPPLGSGRKGRGGGPAPAPGERCTASPGGLGSYRTPGFASVWRPRSGQPDDGEAVELYFLVLEGDAGLGLGDS
jgi:hypothetical protein